MSLPPFSSDTVVTPEVTPEKTENQSLTPFVTTSLPQIIIYIHTRIK